MTTWTPGRPSPSSDWAACGPTPVSSWRFCGAPALLTITPDAALRGFSHAVVLTGAGFDGVSSVQVSGTGITVEDVVVVDAETITATFVIADDATLDDRDVTVTTAAGVSNPVSFTVEPATPVVLSITPNTGVQESVVPVTIIGQYFQSGATVQVSGTLVAPSSVVVVDDETITADLTITLLAAHTTRSVTVTNP